MTSVYILGDIHGEYDAMIKLLDRAGLLDYDQDNIPHWKMDCKDKLIQVGDMIDGCGGSVKSYFFLKRLQREASEEGGKVIRLLGNHELAYVSPIKCSGMEDRTDHLLSEVIKEDILNGEIQASTYLNGYIVSHAGIADNEITRSYGKPVHIVDLCNIRLRSAVRYNDFSGNEMFHVGQSRGGEHAEGGIFWADWRQDRLKNIKQIVGHTSMGGIIINKKHINVDCGISRRAHSVYEILKYENKKFEILKLNK
jgi:hypothetical protein